MKLMYKYQCPICGANLDPGEHCDCEDKSAELLKKFEDILFTDKDGQVSMKEVCA